MSNILPSKVHEFVRDKGLQIVLRDQITKLIDSPDTKNILSLKTSPMKSSQDYRHLEYQMFHVCNKMIGEDYFRRLFNKVFYDMDERYDFVLVIKGISKDDIQIQNVVGYMIMEIGECPIHEYKDIPVLNLICTSSHEKTPIGRLLLFFYVYTLKQAGFSTGLLELANNYSNTAGLCLYNKFGFREYIPLKRSCFNDDFDTLPMIVHLNDPQMTLEAMMDALIENTNIPVSQENELCIKNTPKGPAGKGQKREIKRRTDNFMNMMKINELFQTNKSVDKQLILENMKQNELTDNDDLLEELAKKSLDGKHIVYVDRVKRSRSLSRLRSRHSSRKKKIEKTPKKTRRLRTRHI
jgi:hypothetical protein